MDPSDLPIASVSDTARRVAVYRARETERPDAPLRDPLARRLAGPRGEAIAATTTRADKPTWSFTARTVAFDAFVSAEVETGADLVVNLAAGLDTRPYRMELPASLRWVEIDLPALLDYKEEVLRGETPRSRGTSRLRRRSGGGSSTSPPRACSGCSGDSGRASFTGSRRCGSDRRMDRGSSRPTGGPRSRFAPRSRPRRDCGASPGS